MLLDFLTLRFSSIWVLNRLDDAHSNGWRKSPLFRVLNQMLISSRNTLTDTPRNMFYQLCGHLLAQSSWHIKLITLYILMNLMHKFISSRSFLSILSEFLQRNSSFMNKERVFTFPSQLVYFLFPFLILLNLVWLLVWLWIGGVSENILYLFPDLWRICSVFHH